MGADGRDLDFKGFVSEAPLHEGRDEGVLRSSTRDPFAGAETEAVRCAIGGHGEGPAHVAARVADQEEEARLQVVEQAGDGAPIQLQRMRDLGGSQRPATISREFADDEIADGAMLGGHEGQQVFHGNGPLHLGTRRAGAQRAPRAAISFYTVIYESVVHLSRGILEPMRLEIIFSIHRTTHRIGLFIQRHMPGLTQAEAHILCHLHESGDSTISDLHRAFAHKRSTLTSVLDRLVASGLVTREPSEKDRRSFLVELTAAGRKKAAKVHRLLESLEAGVLRGSDRHKIEAFDQLIRALEQKAEVD